MPLKKTTILLAGDDPQILRLLTRNLQLDGYEVIAVTDGRQRSIGSRRTVEWRTSAPSIRSAVKGEARREVPYPGSQTINKAVGMCQPFTAP